MAEGAGAKHKRRPTKQAGRAFSGLLYCCDCKSKMHFVAAKSMKRNRSISAVPNINPVEGMCYALYP